MQRGVCSAGEGCRLGWPTGRQREGAASGNFASVPGSDMMPLVAEVWLCKQSIGSAVLSQVDADATVSVSMLFDWRSHNAVDTVAAGLCCRVITHGCAEVT